MIKYAKNMFQFSVLLASLAILSPVQAQKKIEIPANARWQHARSQIILPTMVGDLKRTSITDYTQTELNVSVQYTSEKSEATLYIYRPYWADVGAWFERSEAVLMSNKANSAPTAEQALARAFARPNGSINSGIRRNYVYGSGRYKTSGLVIVPYGQWLLKIRYSSSDADISAIDSMVDRILNAIKFPENSSEGSVVQAIETCGETTKWKKAKIIHEDLALTMINSAMFPSIMESDVALPPAPDSVCKVGQSNDKYTLYRTRSGKPKYWMLLMDAGATAQIMEARAALGGKQMWSIMSMDTNHDLLPAFNRMPDPEMWFSVAVSGARRATIIIDPDAPAGTKPETRINVSM